jgi:hypothetical protein
MADNEIKQKINNSITQLEDQINSISDELNIDPENYFPSEKDLPGLGLEIKIFDYEGEILKIKDECRETLSCLSSLYLSEEIIERKNVFNIIQNDANLLSDLKFSLSMSKRALISLMSQIDAGVNHPDMYEAVGTSQKEIRETIKMLYDTQKRMKEFYKELKTELGEINIGNDKNDQQPKIIDEVLTPTDTKLINQLIEEFRENPDLLSNEIKKIEKKKETRKNKK